MRREWSLLSRISSRLSLLPHSDAEGASLLGLLLTTTPTCDPLQRSSAASTASAISYSYIDSTLFSYTADLPITCVHAHAYRRERLLSASLAYLRCRNQAQPSHLIPQALSRSRIVAVMQVPTNHLLLQPTPTSQPPTNIVMILNRNTNHLCQPSRMRRFQGTTNLSHERHVLIPMLSLSFMRAGGEASSAAFNQRAKTRHRNSTPIR